MFQVCPWKWLRRSALRIFYTARRLLLREPRLNAPITMADTPSVRQVVVAISKTSDADSQPSPGCRFFKKGGIQAISFFYCMHNNQALLKPQQALDIN